MRSALLVGIFVLIVRLLTMPRTPWEPEELRFPFAAAVGAGVAASVVTAIALAVAFGPVASLLFSLSAAVLVHAPTGRQDALAWMFLALVFVSWRRPLLIGLFCGAAVLCVPELIVSAVALLFASLLLVVLDRRGRLLAGVAFGLTLLPAVWLYGAPESLPWVVSGVNVVRFVLHPWGSKFIALPLLVCVAIGIRSLRREWNARLEVLLWLAVVHTAVGVAVVDPADGVRWAVPAMMFVAVVAAQAGWIGLAVIATLSAWYTYPLLRDRVTGPSPAVRAARDIPHGAVVLFERERWPGIDGVPLATGLERYLDRPDVQLLLFVAGNSNAPDAKVYASSDEAKDAYGKLTRNAFGKVALIPFRERSLPLRGVYQVERNEAGESWRWIDREAEVRLPRGSKAAHVELRLPADAPFDATTVRVNTSQVVVHRGETIRAEVPVATPHLLFVASHSFTLHGQRRVAVQLMKVEPR